MKPFSFWDQGPPNTQSLKLKEKKGKISLKWVVGVVASWATPFLFLDPLIPPAGKTTPSYDHWFKLFNTPWRMAPHPSRCQHKVDIVVPKKVPHSTFRLRASGWYSITNPIIHLGNQGYDCHMDMRNEPTHNEPDPSSSFIRPLQQWNTTVLGYN